MTRLLRSFFVLSLFIAATAGAQELVHAKRLSPVTLAAIEPFGASQPREVRRHMRTVLERMLPLTAAGVSIEAETLPTLAPPPVTASFGSIGERIYNPADASGAVGIHHVVGATNEGVIVHSRSGEVLASARLEDFMRLPGDTNRDFYDPRIVYDKHADRFVITCIRAEEDLMVAVSQSGDPLGSWNRYQIEATQFASQYIDFMLLALTRDTVMIATDDGAFGIVLSVRKSDLYAGAASVPMRMYRTSGTPVSNDESPVEYVMGVDRVRRLDPNSSAVTSKFINVSCGDCSVPRLLPQRDGARPLDASYSSAESAVLHGGAVWSVTLFSRDNPSRNSIRWTKVNPDTGAVLDAGWIDEPAGPTFFAYPSIAMNRAGEIVVGFGMFGLNRYPTAGYAYRDATGRWSTPGEIRQGDSAYTRSMENPQRWGDYTTAVVDPASEHSFWVLQIVTANSSWRTWWGKITTPTGKQRAVRRR